MLTVVQQHEPPPLVQGGGPAKVTAEGIPQQKKVLQDTPQVNHQPNVAKHNKQVSTEMQLLLDTV